MLGSFEVHEMSSANQSLITPPDLPQTTLVPQLEQDAKIGEKFFADQTAVVASAPARRDDSFDVFIDDGNDDAPSPAPAAEQLDQQEGPAVSATGWCNGDTERLDGSMTSGMAETLGQMPHGRWQNRVESGVPTGIVYTGAEPWTA